MRGRMEGSPGRDEVRDDGAFNHLDPRNADVRASDGEHPLKALDVSDAYEADAANAFDLEVGPVMRSVGGGGGPLLPALPRSMEDVAAAAPLAVEGRHVAE